ncbi:MAG TPA: hypothetical protein VFJ59_17225 [Pseudolabrys sp.]|nr:hypothetical protein [Pseudolabrys sp.]
MLQIAIIIGWLVAFGLMIHLAKQAIKHRLRGRQERKLRFRKVREFIKHHHFDRKRRRWVRSVDGVEVIDEASEDYWFMLTILGWFLFVVWEVYWLSEIEERFRNSTRAWELPYPSLFVVLGVLPLAVYLFFRRRRMRQSARIPEQAFYGQQIRSQHASDARMRGLAA